MQITREQIIEKLKTSLEPNPHVYAFWLEGADSLGTVDKYSDLDIWVDVKDGDEKKIMKQVERILSELGQLDLIQKYNHPDPKIIQTYFHIKNTPEFLLLDVCIQSHSRKFRFTKEITHELPLALFDKKNVTKLYPLNKKKFNKEIENRIEELKQVVAQYSRVTKYVHRNYFLEAMVYYHKWILQPLVELLRIKHASLTHDYYLVHISHHLPKKVVSQIEDLYRINSVSDIGKKCKKAVTLFNKLVKTIKYE